MLRLRGRTALGATAFVMLEDYSRRLGQAGGRLFLSGVDPGLLEQLRGAHRVDVEDSVRVFVATDIIGDASAQAYADAQSWLETSGNL